MAALIETFGRHTASFLGQRRLEVSFLGETLALLTVYLLRPKGVRWRDMFMILEKTLVGGLPVVGVISFLIGLILAFQAAVPLQQFGADIYVVNLVALAMVRELGPLMTAVILAGRSGSAFAAEIGTMKINEEVNALTTMGINPVRFLALPRVIACTIATPILTVYSDLVGVTGGMLFVRLSGHPWAVIWQQLISSMQMHDIVAGLIKATAFGFTVSAVGCLRGMQALAGPGSVGTATTNAVVSAIFLTIVLDAAFATVFFHIGF